MNEKIFDILDSFMPELGKASYVPATPNGHNLPYKPFFSSITIKDLEEVEIYSSKGGIESFKHIPSIKGRLEVRMGDYEKGGGVGRDTFDLPLGLEKDSCMVALWQSSIDSFWKCVDDYHKRFGNSLGTKDGMDKYIFFSHENPANKIEDEKSISFDKKRIEDMLKTVSKRLLRDEFYDADLTFSAKKENMYFVSSEGSKIFTSFVRYSFDLELYCVDSKGLLIPYSYVIHTLDREKFPSTEDLLEKGEVCARDLLEIINSPIQKNGSYPSILDNKNACVLCHEAIGHLLEANIFQEDSDEGQSNTKVAAFEGRLGDEVAPEFLSLYDDPTIPNLDGSYSYDEEGVKSQRVNLIKNGILENYLHSRQSAGFLKTKSNGHARAEEIENPIPRMSNLFLESENKVSFEELKDSLIKIMHEKNRQYGLILQDTEGGLVLPEESFFNVTPQHVFQMDRKGNMKRVRGVYIVGTPYQIISNIVQTSDRIGTFNGLCGSDSGWIPSTQSAPDLLVKEVEINRIPNKAYERVKEPVIDKPYFSRG